MASVTFQKRGDEKSAHGLRWTVTIRHEALPRSISKTFLLKKEGRRWGQDLLKSVESGEWHREQDGRRKLTFREALERYALEVTSKKNGWRQENRRVDAWQRTALADWPLYDLRSTNFAAWRREREAAGKSSSTIRSELNLVSHMYNVARTEWGYEDLANPLAGLRRTRAEGMPEGRERRLRPGEEDAILAAADEPLRSAFVLAIDTAMRQGELLRLRWEWVGEDHVIRLPPTRDDRRKQRRREIPLTQRARAVLAALDRPADGRGRVWPEDFDQDRLEYLWARLCGKRGARNGAGPTGLDLTDLRWHDLRHEATSRLFERDFQIHEVRHITGHRTLEMLLRYTHVKVESLLARVG